MECRYVTEQEYDLLRSALSHVMCQINAVETYIGCHEHYGVTTLTRDGSRCMAVVDNPAPLDRFLAERAFLTDGKTARVAGRG